jgi:hypothetical protein
VDLDYLADNLWLVGAPATVAERICDLRMQTGGFGYLVITSYEATDEREPWQRSLRLLVEQVLPACKVWEDRDYAMAGGRPWATSRLQRIRSTRSCGFMARARLSRVEEWDRANGRGRRFDLGGIRLEILDNARERQSLDLREPADRIHVVVEVDDIDATRRRLATSTPSPQTTSWGARLFQVRDPDGCRNFPGMDQAENWPNTRRIIIGNSGATGVIYGIRLLEVLRDMNDVETHHILENWNNWSC